MTAATQLVTALGPDTPDDGEPGRQQRGLAIAALVPIQEHKHGYRVPSQSGRGDYIVSIDEDGRFCTCPDYALRQKDCKHLLAVQFRALRESAASGAVAAEIKAITAATATSRPKAQPISTVNMGIEIEDDGDATGPVASSVPEEEAVVEENKGKKKRPTYQRDWRKYDASKEYEEENFEVLLADIASLVRQPAYEFGRPQLLLSDVVYSLVRKAYGGQSRRIVMSSLRRAEEKRLITKAPSQGSISKYLERVALTPILKHLIQQSTLPLWGLDNGVYATDATGFRTSVYNRWFEHKWEEGQESKEVKERKKRQWIKAHCVFGTTTKVVTAVEVSNGTEADTNYLQDLTKATLSEHEVIDMCVDLGYLDNDHYEFMDSLNINLWMPFKVNSKESSPNRWPVGTRIPFFPPAPRGIPEALPPTQHLGDRVLHGQGAVRRVRAGTHQSGAVQRGAMQGTGPQHLLSHHGDVRVRPGSVLR